MQVPAGETSPWIPLRSREVTVVVDPGNGGSMRAEATFSRKALVDANTALAVVWPAGTVTALTSLELKRATAVRFVASGAAGVGEVAS